MSIRTLVLRDFELDVAERKIREATSDEPADYTFRVVELRSKGEPVSLEAHKDLVTAILLTGKPL